MPGTDVAPTGLKEAFAALKAPEADDVTLDIRIFNGLTLMCGVMSLAIFAPINHAIGMGALHMATLYVLGIASLVLFVLSKLYRRPHIWTLLAILNACLGIFWFTNGGSTGIIPYFLALSFVAGLILMSGKMRLAMGSINVALFSSSMTIEFIHPEWVTAYETELDRFVDFFTGYLAFLLATGVVLNVILKNYERERNALEQTSLRLGEANAELARLSTVDALTGLHNRRYFDEHLDITWRECRRLEVPLSIIMIDIDHFKKFNDTYGHAAGDGCLRSVAGCLRASLRRATDLLTRYGGEEFVVIIKDDLATATRVADNLLRAVRDLNTTHSEAPVGFVTISLGVSSVVPDGEDSQAELLRRADDALYVSKSEGRNMLSVAPGKG